jgi:OOP family OmpA-OmpF porin
MMPRWMPLAIIAALLIATGAQAAHRHPMRRAPRWKTAVESDRRVLRSCCMRDADTDGDGVSDRFDLCPNTPAGCKVDDYGCPWDSDGDGVCDGLDRCPGTPAGAKVDAHGCDAEQLAARGASAPPIESKSTPPPAAPMPPPSPPRSAVEKKLIASGEIRLEDVHFETNSATLLPESETTLDEAGRALEHFVDLKIEVQGHTDTRGSGPYNMKLSQARAESVRKYLLDHFQLSPDNYIAKGYGKTQPETQERNQEELLRNRRVILNVLNPEVLPGNVKVEHKE